MQAVVSAELSRWRGYINSDPERVLAVLRLRDPSLVADELQAPNEWGDTHKSIFYAISALGCIPGTGPSWQRLVRGGLVDLLCQKAVELDPQTATFPQFAEGMSDAALSELPAPWYGPLLPLCAGAKNIQESMTPEDTLLVETLKRHWSTMMRRIWETPGSSLKAEEHFYGAPQRGIVSDILEAITSRDPSFWATVDECPHTIPVIVRNFLHANQYTSNGKPAEFIELGYASLWPVISPKAPSAEAYRLAHPLPSSTLERVRRGADGCLNRIAFKLFGHFDRLELIYAYSCLNFLDGLTSLIKSEEGPLHIEEYAELICSETHWKGIITCARRAAGDQTLPRSNEFRGSITTRLLTEIYIQLTLNVEGELSPTQRRSFLQALVNADIFGFLEDALPIYNNNPVNMVHRPLYCLFRALRLHVGLDQQPLLAAVLRPHLPRPRILHALLMSAFFKDGQFVEPSHKKVDVDANSTNDTDLAECEEYCREVNFSMFSELEKDCQLNTECGRRGCTKERRAGCAACHAMMYCGPECQKRDWPEHKLVCGFSVTPEGVDSAVVSFPKRF